jgi:predicted DNA-binding protein YlxM (UPF0122 family)
MTPRKRGEVLRMPNGDVIEQRKPLNSKFVDHTGKKFGMLTVLGLVGFVKKYAVYRCKCECGKEILRRVNFLIYPDRQGSGSCGCAWRNNDSELVKSLRGVWARIKQTKGFKWKSIEQFADNVGERPSKRHVLARKDESKPWGPGNFAWRIKAKYSVDGLYGLNEIAAAAGVSRQRISQRIKNGHVDIAAPKYQNGQDSPMWDKYMTGRTPVVRISCKERKRLRDNMKAAKDASNREIIEQCDQNAMQMKKSREAEIAAMVACGKSAFEVAMKYGYRFSTACAYVSKLSKKKRRKVIR